MSRTPRLVALLLLGVTAGCGTTRMTDTQRTATEQLLVSNAIDQAVSEFDFRALAGKPVYFDPQYLEGVVDRGYLISSLRQHLLAAGCLLQEDRNRSAYVVEAGSGGVGTNRHALLLGVPQMTVPALLPGQPSQIPEIPLAKKTDQEGIAKIAVFAYNRMTGQPLWQSGVVQAASTAKDTWVLGAGPFQHGTIRKGTEFAGEPLPRFGIKGTGEENLTPAVLSVTRSARWPEPPAPKTDSKQLAYRLGNVPVDDRPRLGESTQVVLALVEGDREAGRSAESKTWPLNQLMPAERSPASSPPVSPVKAELAAPVPINAGGQAETEPCKINTSGLGSRPGLLTETEANQGIDSAMGFKPAR